MFRDRFSTQKFLAWAAVWFFLSAGFSALAAWQAERTLARDLSRQLNQQLPEKLALALQARLSGDQLANWVAARLEQDLASLPAYGLLPLIHRCSVGVSQLVDDPAFANAEPRHIEVRWQIGNEPRFSAFSLECQYNWPLLVGWASLLGLLITIGMALVPAPLDSTRRARITELIQNGLTFRQARRFAEDLDTEQARWFDRALLLNGGNVETALHCAETNHRLVFDCMQLQVRVRGIPDRLSKTPFFYYLWYAQHRQQGEGWVLNPPVNRPDREGAVPLMVLMADHGGHAKSINDLRENGLRAKTLDQNRNKIRDELVNALGENLAAPYLFESERDLKSGRYRYRLALDFAHVDVLID